MIENLRFWLICKTNSFLEKLSSELVIVCVRALENRIFVNWKYFWAIDKVNKNDRGIIFVAIDFRVFFKAHYFLGKRNIKSACEHKTGTKNTGQSYSKDQNSPGDFKSVSIWSFTKYWLGKNGNYFIPNEKYSKDLNFSWNVDVILGNHSLK